MKYKLFFSVIFLLQLIFACNPNLSNSDDTLKSTQSHVVLVSIDGFRYDYAEKFGAKNLIKIGENGTKAESLIPCYPTKTFPNHYSIVTGLYPDNHGIVDNYFYDPESEETFSLSSKNPDNGKWFGGTPFWQLVNESGLNSASYFWIGSDMNINGNSPTYFKTYNESTPNCDRVNQVLNWLNLPVNERPQFITLYFSDVDTQGHNFGPDSKETKAAVLEIDHQLGQLYDGISKLNYPVNLVIVSDHGQTALDSTKGIFINKLIEEGESVKYIPRDALLMLYSNDSLEKENIYLDIKSKEDNRFTSYKKDNIPQHLHFGKNNRVGDILLIANPPYSFTLPNASITKGTHGFDASKVKDMHGIFYAVGPNFKNSYSIPPFENIHIYPMLAEILQLKYDSSSIDGKIEVVSEVAEYAEDIDV